MVHKTMVLKTKQNNVLMWKKTYTDKILSKIIK